MWQVADSQILYKAQRAKNISPRPPNRIEPHTEITHPISPHSTIIIIMAAGRPVDFTKELRWTEFIMETSKLLLGVEAGIETLREHIDNALVGIEPNIDLDDAQRILEDYLEKLTGRSQVDDLRASMPDLEQKVAS